MPILFETYAPAIAVARKVIRYVITPLVTPKGTITRISPPDGAYIAPDSSFACVIWFRNDTTKTFTFTTQFIAKGVKTGITHFNAKSAPKSIVPGAEGAMSSGTKKMPNEDVEMTIIVWT